MATTAEKHLSWLDLLVIVALAVASFAASALVRTGWPWDPREPVPPAVVFQAEGGVPARKEDLAVVQAQQAKIRELLAKRYVEAVPGVTPSPTPAPSGKPPPPAPVSTVVLRSESAALATAYREKQVALAAAERRAERARTLAAGARNRRDAVLRALVSLAVLAVLCTVVAVLGRRTVHGGYVGAGAVAVLGLLIIADVFSWVIAAVIALAGVVVLARKGAP